MQFTVLNIRYQGRFYLFRNYCGKQHNYRNNNYNYSNYHGSKARDCESVHSLEGLGVSLSN